MSNELSPVPCKDCGIDTRFLGWIDCEDGVRRCFGCWEIWVIGQGEVLNYEHCDDCGFPLVPSLPIMIGNDYKIRCIHCHQKKYGVSAS